MLLQELEKLEHGKPRIDAIKESIKTAEHEKDIDTEMQMRFCLIQESTFYSNGYDCVVSFPQMIAKMDFLEKEGGAGAIKPYTHLFMVCFQWYLSQSSQYYQIVQKTTEQLRREYKKRCTKYGYSLRSYYMMKLQTAKNENFIPHWLRLYRAEKRDILSPARDFELYQEMVFELRLHNEENALELEKLFHEQNFPDSDDTRFFINCRFARHFNKENKYDHAKPYAIKAFEYLQENPYEFNHMGDILLVCANIDVQLGLKVFVTLLDRIKSHNNPSEQFTSFKASLRLLRKLYLRDIFTIECLDGTHDTRTLFDWFYKEAMALAEKFDKSEEGTQNKEDIEGLELL